MVPAVVATVFLAACGSASAPTTQVSARPYPTAASGTLHIYNWTNYIDPAEIDRFTKETGITVVLDVYDSNETMLAKLQSGSTGYDVIFPSDYMVTQLKQLGLILPIDIAHFPNAKNIKDEFVSVPWDSDRMYSAPYMYGTTGIACDPAGSDCSAVKSWHDFFTSKDPKLSTIKDEMEVVSAALRAVGVSGDQLCTATTDKFAQAEKLLADFSPMAVDSDSSTERMLNSTSTLELTWNGEAHRMRTKLPNLEYIYPTEGVNRWADNMAVPVGATNPDAAMVFINWMMDPKNIGAESNFTGYDNSIVGSLAFMEPTITSDPAVVPPADVVSRMSAFPDCPQDVRDLYSQVFTTWLAK